MALGVALGLLIAALAAAILAPRGIPEVAVAGPAAVICVLTGLTSTVDATDQLRALSPTLGFLAAVLVLARLAELDGVFDWAGALLSRAAGRGGRTLLGWVLGVGFLITTTLSLDATVVLFTPVVALTAARARLRARPHLHATVHVANAGSLLLPVSNLTNLLALRGTGLSVAGFAGLMALPTLAVLVIEYLGARVCFAGDLRAQPDRVEAQVRPALRPAPVETGRLVPRYSLLVLGVTLLGFVLSSSFGIPVGVVAAAGSLALGARRLWHRTIRVRDVLGWADPGFLLFVAALSVIVDTVSRRGLDRVVRPLVQRPNTLIGLLAIALVAALLANMLNNLPAMLLLLPALAGPGPVLAALIGVNIGPNLTYVGSLATMLWLRVTRRSGYRMELGTFTRHGLCTVPAALTAATAALWLGLRLTGRT